MKRSILVSLGVGVIVAAAGGGYYFLHKKHQPPRTGVSSKDGFESLEDIRKAQGMVINTNLDSPAGKAWKAKDFAALKKLFGVDKTVKANHSFFQASIFVLDVTKPTFKPEERQGLQEVQNAIVDYILAKREKPVLGQEAQVLSYASKVLLKFDSLPDDAVNRLVSFYFGSVHADNLKNQNEIVGETIIRLNPLPEKARKIVRERIHAKADPYQGVVLLGRMRDQKAAVEFWNEVAKDYKSYPDKYQAMIFKQLAINHSFIKTDLKKYLNDLLKQSGEDREDAFLIGVRELDALPDYRSDVQRIANQTQFQQNKVLALSLLNSSTGAR